MQVHHVFSTLDELYSIGTSPKTEFGGKHKLLPDQQPHGNTSIKFRRLLVKEPCYPEYVSAKNNNTYLYCRTRRHQYTMECEESTPKLTQENSKCSDLYTTIYLALLYRVPNTETSNTKARLKVTGKQ